MLQGRGLLSKTDSKRVQARRACTRLLSVLLNILSPVERERLQQQGVDGDEEEESDQERHIEHSHRAHDAANGGDERVGHARQEADKGKTFVRAKPRSKGADN